MCSKFRSKGEGTAKNLFSPLQYEIISAFLRAGLQKHSLPAATEPRFHSWAQNQEGKPILQGETGEETWAGRASSREGMGSLHTSQGDGLSLGHLGTPSAPLS